MLGAEVPASWPPGEYDHSAMEFFRERLIESGAAAAGWYGWYAIRVADSRAARTLVGAGGYFGPASPQGAVEIGYSVAPEWHRNGFAREIVRMLVEHAFDHEAINLIAAHTAEANIGSVRALERNGFRRHGLGRDPETIRFELACNEERSNSGASSTSGSSGSSD